MTSPFQIARRNPSGQLDLSCYISTSKIVVNNDGSFDNYGRWLDINDGLSFRIAKGLDEAAVSFRREEVTNPFLEGAYVVNALRENMHLNLEVRAIGETHMDMVDTLRKLTDALGQVSFKLQVTVDNAQWTYNCYASDYSVLMPPEYLHARMATVKAQILHHPVVAVNEVI